ncbi:MAG: toll/interleukin-1 receptor domain-containing protein [Cyanobacteria bacterium P01_D01_bin.56]
MDVAQLTQFLLPCLPTLLQSHGAIPVNSPNTIDPGTWTQARQIWEKLWPSIDSKETAKEALLDVVQNPQDADLQVAVRVQLKKLLEQDPTLANAIDAIFQDNPGPRSPAVHITQRVYGNHNQVIGQVSGGTIIGSMSGASADRGIQTAQQQTNVSAPAPKIAASSEPVTVFFSYAQKDELLRNELSKHLSILERNSVIAGWHDQQIMPGQEGAQAVGKWLDNAQIILLLVSSDFIASESCWNIDVQRAMERHAAGEAQVIPILLRPVSWQGAPFGTLRPLPSNGKPVTTWASMDEAFLDIAQGIEAVVSSLSA